MSHSPSNDIRNLGTAAAHLTNGDTDTAARALADLSDQALKDVLTKASDRRRR